MIYYRLWIPAICILSKYKQLNALTNNNSPKQPLVSKFQKAVDTNDTMLVYGLWVNLPTTHFLQINEKAAPAN